MLGNLVAPQTSMLALVAPRYGFLGAVYEIELEGDDPAVHSHFAKTVDPAAPGDVLAHGRMECGGAGLSRDASITATIGEAVERYALAQRRSMGAVASIDELGTATAPAIAPEELKLFSPSQHATRSFPHPPFTTASRLHWTLLDALDGGDAVYFPSCLLYIPYAAREGEDILAPAISTGAACGPSRPAVVAAGLLECIERDSIMVHWMTGMTPTELRPTSIPGLAEEFRHHFDRPWLEYHLYLFANDLDVPVVFCVLLDSSEYELNLMCGGAASFDLVAAARKALVEAVQGRFWAKYMRKSGQLATHVKPEEIGTFSEHVRYYAQESHWAKLTFLHDALPVAEAELARLLDVPGLSPGPSARELIGRVAAAGSRVLYLDLTTPDIAAYGLVAGKVVTPGLVNLNDGVATRFLGSPRFEDVPIGLGRPVRYLRADGFNPLPHPFP